MIDCHIHTNYSDGLCEAEVIVKRCQELGMELFAIADHDTISGLKKFEGFSEHLIFGTEITAMYKGIEVHVLAYFATLPADNFETYLKNNRVKSAIQRLRKKKEKYLDDDTIKNITQMIEKLGGVSIIAHPFNYWDIVDAIINDFDGIELIYPSHTKEDIDTILEKYGKKCRFFTAGSDYHGDDFRGNDYINECCQEYSNYLMPFITFFQNYKTGGAK